MSRTVLGHPNPEPWAQLDRVGLLMVDLLGVQIAADTFVD